MDELSVASSGESREGATAPSDRIRTEQEELAALLRASSRGDESAFARLYDRTSARIYGLALRVVRDPSMSEEVAQDVYLDAWRNSSRFDPERGSAMSWLLTMTHRKSVDKVRASEASRARDGRHAAGSQTVDYDETSEAATASLEAQRVRRALASLTENQRGAVELAYLGGYTHTEVATLLNLPLGTAKTRIRDGLIRLRDVLGAPA